MATIGEFLMAQLGADAKEALLVRAKEVAEPPLVSVLCIDGIIVDEDTGRPVSRDEMQAALGGGTPMGQLATVLLTPEGRKKLR